MIFITNVQQLSDLKTISFYVIAPNRITNWIYPSASPSDLAKEQIKRRYVMNTQIHRKEANRLSLWEEERPENASDCQKTDFAHERPRPYYRSGARRPD